MNAVRVFTKGWSLEEILSRGTNFLPVPVEDVEHQSAEQIDLRVRDTEADGIPLVMQNWHKRPGWNAEIFSPTWLTQNEGDAKLKVRNLYDREDHDSSLAEYLVYASSTAPYAKDDEQERLYAKDAKCPEEWNSWLKENLPAYLLPFDYGDTGAQLSSDKRVETLMTYIGLGDTYTPAHKDGCASIGQNLMVHTADDNASSFWFMTSTSDAHKASAYWRRLGHELDLETHLATIDELSQADFDIYVCQQRLGDFVIVPPQCCHQVVNTGNLTMKVAWSRMTPQSLSLALQDELPIYQRVCRPETYRVKDTIEAMLTTYLRSLENKTSLEELPGSRPVKIEFLEEILPLYRRLLYESYDIHHDSYEIISFDGEFCDFCGACLWFCAMRCTSCIKLSDEDTAGTQQAFLLCAACYADGRSCFCKVMEPVQTGYFHELLDLENKAVALLNKEKENLGEEPQLVPLSEDQLVSDLYPPVFRVACFLYRQRKAYGVNGLQSMRKCNVYRGTELPDQERHSFFLDEGLVCSGCHASHCWYHILRRYGYHWVSIVIKMRLYQTPKLSGFTSKTLELEQWHTMHSKSKLSVDYYPKFGGPWKEWLPQLAWHFRASRPLNPYLLKGWYDRERGTSDASQMEAETLTRATLKLFGESSSASEYAPQPKKESIKRKASSQSLRTRPQRKRAHIETYSSSSDQLNTGPAASVKRVALSPRRKSRPFTEKAAPRTTARMVAIPISTPVKALPFLSSYAKPSPRTDGTASPTNRSTLDFPSSPMVRHSPTVAQISSLENTVRQLVEENREQKARIERLEGEMEHMRHLLITSGEYEEVEEEEIKTKGSEDMDQEADDATERASEASQENHRPWSRWFSK